MADPRLNDVNDKLKKFYEANKKDAEGIKEYSLDHIDKVISAINQDPPLTQEEKQIATMQFVADLAAGKIPKRADLQTTSILAELNDLFQEADKPEASKTLKSAADEIRTDPKLQSAIIRVQTNALREAGGMVSKYHTHFNDLLQELIQNKVGILKANPILAENNEDMYKRLLQTLQNVSKIYNDKWNSLNDDDKKLLAKLTNSDPVTKMPKDLSVDEYNKAVKLIGNLLTFEESHVNVFIDSMSVYQSMLPQNLLGSQDKDHPYVLDSNKYGYLFQAPMRHPMMMETVIKSAQKAQVGMPMAVSKEIVQHASGQYDLTKKLMLDVNYGIGNNFMLDGNKVLEFISLGKKFSKMKGITAQEKKLLGNYAKAMDAFMKANNQYYLDRSPKTEKNFEKTFEALMEAHREVSSHVKIKELATNPEFLKSCRDAGSLKPNEMLSNTHAAVEQGLPLYFRLFQFDTYRKDQMAVVVKSLSRLGSQIDKLPATKDLSKKIQEQIAELYNAKIDDKDEKAKKAWVDKVIEVKNGIDLLDAKLKEALAPPKADVTKQKEEVAEAAKASAAQPSSSDAPKRPLPEPPSQAGLQASTSAPVSPRGVTEKEVKSAFSAAQPSSSKPAESTVKTTPAAKTKEKPSKRRKHSARKKVAETLPPLPTAPPPVTPPPLPADEEPTLKTPAPPDRSKGTFYVKMPTLPPAPDQPQPSAAVAPKNPAAQPTTAAPQTAAATQTQAAGAKPKDPLFERVEKFEKSLEVLANSKGKYADKEAADSFLKILRTLDKDLGQYTTFIGFVNASSNITIRTLWDKTDPLKSAAATAGQPKPAAVSAVQPQPTVSSPNPAPSAMSPPPTLVTPPMMPNPAPRVARPLPQPAEPRPVTFAFQQRQSSELREASLLVRFNDLTKLSSDPALRYFIASFGQQLIEDRKKNNGALSGEMKSALHRIEYLLGKKEGNALTSDKNFMDAIKQVHTNAQKMNFGGHGVDVINAFVQQLSAKMVELAQSPQKPKK